jgi:hypothetical protein
LPFRVRDIRRVSATIYYDTTLPGTINVPTASTGSWKIRAHPSESCTVRGCSGSQDIMNLSAAFPGAPFGSYMLHRSQAVSGLMNPSEVWGTLVKFRINVSRAYTGVQATLLLRMGAVGLLTLSSANGATVTQWDVKINVKIAGERIITPGLTTGTQTGDANMTTGGLWIMNGFQPKLQDSGGSNLNISSENSNLWPIIELELITDQKLI